MSRGRRAAFPEAATNTGIKPSVITANPRRFAVRVGGGDELLIDLTSWSRPSLAAEMAPLLHETVRRMGPTPIARSVRRKVRQLLRFWRFLDASGAALSDLGGMTVAIINDYERWLEQNGVWGLHQRHLLAAVIGPLRIAAETKPGLLATETVARLTYLGHGDAGSSRPRDAYSSRVAEALRTAARAQVVGARQRVATGDATPAVLAGVDISERLRSHYDAVMLEIDRSGPVDTRHEIFKRFVNLARYWDVDCRTETVHAGYYLTRMDFVAFLVLLSLQTGMEMECLIRLKADCLRNPAKGYVEIEYHKRRARGSEWKRLRVRDGSSATPGGLIRLALALTERARRHIGTDRLWVIWTVDGLRPPGEESAGVEAFVRHYGVVDDDGSPLRLRLSRLRKTNKAEWYRRTGGQLEHFAVGHSIGVAARHYADIPALRHVHDQALSDAFSDALDAALKPRLFVASDEDTGPEPVAEYPPLADAPISADQDLWLARCDDFYDSPFGSSGAACPTPFWGCLECKNAVITARKLPALIAFQTFLADQRAALGARDWSIKFGRAWHRVAEQILPAFPPELVAEAQAAAAAAGPELLYLPPEAYAR